MDMNEKPKLLKKTKPVSNISNKIVVMEKQFEKAFTDTVFISCVGVFYVQMNFLQTRQSFQNQDRKIILR